MVSRRENLNKHLSSQLATAKSQIATNTFVVDFYAFEVGLDRVLVNCGHHCLYICRYPVYNNVVNFYTFEGDLYNWG